MRRLALLSFASLLGLAVFAQSGGKEKPASKWKTGGMITVMGGQSGTRNWAPAGSEKFALSLMSNLNLFANGTWGKNSWENNLELSYALVKTTSQGFRKIDDKFDFYSKYGYGLSNHFSVGVVGALRTQLTNGYDYSETIKRRTSGFFAPAYITLSPGIQWKTLDNAFSIHVGPSVRWVVVTNEPYSLNYQGGTKPDGTFETPLAIQYGVNPGNKVRYNYGAFVSAQFKKEVAKNVQWRSRADVHLDVPRDRDVITLPSGASFAINTNRFTPDIYWTNTISMTVNKWLKVNYNFDIYYDKDVKMFGENKDESRLQMRSLLGVGLGVAF